MKRNRKSRKPETVKVGNVVVKIYRRDKLVKSKHKDGKTTVKEYRIWEVENSTAGTRMLQSFSDHTKALALAQRLAEQISTGKTVAAGMSNNEAASFGRSTELLPEAVTLEIAVATYAKAFTILGGDRIIEAATFFKRNGAGEVSPRTVVEVIEELVQAKRQRTKKGKPASETYLRDLSNRLSTFAKDFSVDIGTITTPDVQRWLDRRKVEPQTARNFRTVLHTLFHFAEARGYVFKGGNPVAGTEHIATNGGGAIEIYTPAEIAGLLSNAPKDFLPLLALGAFAGLRAAEVERLEWSDIDLGGGFIHVGEDKAKTASRRLVPILTTLSQWLAPYAGRKGLVWNGSPKELRTARAATVKAAGTEWKDNGLRHSFISYRLAEVQSAAQVALEAGNSPAMVFRHYRELVKPEAAKAWFAVGPEQPANVLPMKEAANA